MYQKWVESSVVVPRWAMILTLLALPAGVAYVVRVEVSQGRLDERVSKMETDHKANNVSMRLTSVEATLGHLVKSTDSLTSALRAIERRLPREER